MKKVICVLLLLIVSFQLAANETSPAYWETQDLPEHFGISRYPGGLEKEVFCSSVLLINNKLAPTLCYFHKDDVLAENMFKMFRRATGKLIRHRAKLHGKTKSVRFGFTLKLLTTETKKEISLLHAIEPLSDDTDFSYIAPQRITAVRPTVSLRGCNFNTSVWINVSVDKHGKATAVEFEDVVAKDECLSTLKAQFMGARYIPAHQAGDTVSGVYKEYIECMIKTHGCKLRYGT